MLNRTTSLHVFQGENAIIIFLINTLYLWYIYRLLSIMSNIAPPHPFLQIFQNYDTVISLIPNNVD